MRRRRSSAIDTHDVSELRGVVRRTRLVRLVLAAAAVAALLATVASARSLDAQRHTIVPSGSTGVIVVDVSLSIANSYGDVRRTLQNVVGGDAPVGLVVFSDVPYELFPPGTPASELEPVLRVLTPPERGEQPTPWTQRNFRGALCRSRERREIFLLMNYPSHSFEVRSGASNVGTRRSIYKWRGQDRRCTL